MHDLLASGGVHPKERWVMRNSMVVDPAGCLEEMEGLKARGYLPDAERVVISENAHVIFPYHKRIDQLREELRGKGKIGTTGRGIGPAYEDKAGRLGIRMGELVEPDLLKRRLEQILPEKNLLLEKVMGGKGFTFREIFEPYARYGQELKGRVKNVSLLLDEAMRQKSKILFEGAQGTSLDIDHGTYPYVTSSNTVAAGACTGSGIGPRAIDEVIGVCKAYTTRVGSGPFPSELTDEIGKRLQDEGAEFGATTGRPRRCGWLDFVLLRHAVRTNGLTGIVVTKLDILSGLEPLRVCVAYRWKGRRLTEMPASVQILEECEPIYDALEGWREPLSGIRGRSRLPAAAQQYLRRIEKEAGVPLAMISVGPSREDSVVLHTPFS